MFDMDKPKYYKLSTRRLPREKVLEWCRSLRGHQPRPVNVMELKGDIYYVCTHATWLDEQFEAWLRQQNAPIESTTTPPEGWGSRSRSSSGSAGAAAGGGGPDRGRS